MTKRRKLLEAGVVTGLLGMGAVTYDVLPVAGAVFPQTTPGAATNETPEATATPPPTRTPPETPATGEEETPSGPSPPEPGVTVAADGSAEYTDLQAAYRVAKRTGDTVGIGPGEYTYDPFAPGVGPPKPVTFVGAGADSTRVTVAYDDTPTVDTDDRKLPIVRNPPEFWDLTLDTAGVQYGLSETLRLYDCRSYVPIKTGSGKKPARVEARNSVVAAPTDVDLLDVDQCAVTNWARAGTVEAANSSFRGSLVAAGGNITASRVAGLGIGGPNLVVAGSRLSTAGFGSIGETSVSDGTAIEYRTDDLAGTRVIDSRITGRIRDGPEGAGRGIDAYRGNTFVAGEDVEYFVDGVGAKRFVENAFIGGDVRIDDADVWMYDPDNAVGNYYSAFDRTDKNGDGIIDYARPIPGTGKVTDQYPLVDPPGQ